ncbi:hypothetical protein FRB91_001869, partial [Serendipita sp. 411]
LERREPKIHINWHKVGEFFSHAADIVTKILPIPVLRIANTVGHVIAGTVEAVKAAKAKGH